MICPVEDNFNSKRGIKSLEKIKSYVEQSKEESTPFVQALVAFL